MNYAKGSLAHHLKKLIKFFCVLILELLFNLSIEIVENSIEYFFLKIIGSHELCCEPEIPHIGCVFLMLMGLESAIVRFSIEPPSL